MKRAFALSITALLLSSGPVLAGEEEKQRQLEKKCAAEATICVREMASALKKKGWVGIEWEEQDGRPVISYVVEGSPAAAAGIRVGDLVMAFAGVSTAEDEETVWAAMKRSLVPGKVLTVDVVRDGVELALDVELVAVPEQIIAQWVGKHMLEHHAAPPDEAAAESP